MPSSLSDLTSASAIFLVGYPAWMAYTGLYPTYLLQNVVVLLAILSSGYYHACWTTDPPYCPYHATREVQDFADLLFAFMGLVASTPLIYEWWLKLRFTVHGKAIHATYCTVGCLLTFVLVTHFQQGVGTTLTLALYYGLPLCYALYRELVRDGERHNTWWFVRLVAGLACIAAGVVVFEIETNREFNPDTLCSHFNPPLPANLLRLNANNCPRLDRPFPDSVRDVSLRQCPLQKEQPKPPNCFLTTF